MRCGFGAVLLAHAREKGVGVDFRLLRGGYFHVSVGVRLGLGGRIALRGRIRRLRTLDQFQFLGPVHFLGPGLGARTDLAHRRLHLLFEIDEEGLLLRWRPDVFQAREGKTGSGRHVNGRRQDHARNPGHPFLLLSVTQVLFHLSIRVEWPG